MGRIFASQADSTKVTDLKDKKLADLVAQAAVSGLTWQELALFNWGTREPAEVNRALAESIGCKTVDASDPSQTVLDPDRGPGGSPGVFLPKLWTGAENLAPSKTHTITLKKRQPPPAVAILKCPRWSPPGKAFALEYRLEGTVARADKVDFEVHVARYHDAQKKAVVTRYFEEDKHGSRTDSGTQGKSPDTTHLVRRRLHDLTGARAPSSAQTYAGWEGESEAKAGVLKAQGSGKTYVTHACAPYSVMLRYYKDDADQETKLLLLPFFPRWDPKNVLVDASLVVEWEVAGAGKDKLKAGLLTVVDKDDKVVYEVALDASRIAKKKFDLLNDAPSHKLDKKLVTKAAMPFRVQLQAHSDATEEKGLAIATMHTAVKAMVYEKAQFVAFDVQPATKMVSGLEGYRGDKDDVTDIDARCAFMTSAIQEALGKADASEDVLKVFMAPEFFYRGYYGGYEANHLGHVVDQMRKETDKFDYADWMFVFGTAIGYIRHGGDDGPTVDYSSYGLEARNANVDAVDPSDPKITVTFDKEVAEHVVAQAATDPEWRAVQGSVEARITGGTATSETEATLDLVYASSAKFTPGPIVVTEVIATILDAKHSGPKSVLTVYAPPFARIQLATGAPIWWVQQGGTMAPVETCTAVHPGLDRPDHQYELLLGKNEPALKKGPFVVREPASAEVMNVALVQKGWPAPEPDERVLKAAAIYKEYVSQLDFLSEGMSIFLDPTEADPDKRMKRLKMPTEGSRDYGGGNKAEPALTADTPRTWTDKQGVEHTVGSEVNLTGIGGGSIVTLEGIAFGVEICLDHNTSRLGEYYDKSARPGDPKVQIHLIPSWGASIGLGKIVALKDGLVFNVDGQRGDSVARVNDAKWSCDDHASQTGSGAGDCPDPGHDFDVYKCNKCAKLFVSKKSGDPCPEKTCKGNSTLCTQCNKCGNWARLTAGKKCNQKLCTGTMATAKHKLKKAFQQIGSPIARVATVTPAVGSTWSTYFDDATKQVVVYAVTPIPAPDTV